MSTSSNSDATVSAETGGLTLFEWFPKLLIEIRFKILHIPISQAPRIIEVRFSRDARRRRHDVISSIPVLLHVSREARQETLKLYPLSFDTKHAVMPVHFNFEIDSLFVRKWNSSYSQLFSFLESLPKRGKIRSLVIDRSIGSLFNILQFQALDKVIILESILTQNLGHDCYKPSYVHAQSPDDEQVLRDFPARAEVIHEHNKEFVSNFLRELQNSDRRELQWKEPEFVYRAVYNSFVSQEHWYCKPPKPEKVHATRSKEKLV